MTLHPPCRSLANSLDVVNEELLSVSELLEYRFTFGTTLLVRLSLSNLELAFVHRGTIFNRMNTIVGLRA